MLKSNLKAALSFSQRLLTKSLSPRFLYRQSTLVTNPSSNLLPLLILSNSEPPKGIFLLIGHLICLGFKNFKRNKPKPSNSEDAPKKQSEESRIRAI